MRGGRGAFGDARAVVDGAIGQVRWRFARKPPSPWQPRNIPDAIEGFDTTIEAPDLIEACRRLGVVAVGEPVLPMHRRTLGTRAVGPDGRQSWVKVSALRDTPTHWMREGEQLAVPGTRRPEVIASREWRDGNRHWLALQMEVVDVPMVETTPWAGPRAAGISDGWIGALQEALAAVDRWSTQRRRITPEGVAATIERQFGSGAPRVADEWRPAHGDLHWNNVTVEPLMILDWEHVALVPRGFDGAYLIAFSCWYPQLIARLKRAFAADLATPSGRVAQLFAIALVSLQLEAGWFNPMYRVPLRHLARRVLRRD